MTKVILTVLGAIGLSCIVLFVAPLLGIVFGSLAGWVVGLFFSETILGMAAAVGVTGFEMWQIGAALGFISMFFRVANATIKS